MLIDVLGAKLSITTDEDPRYLGEVLSQYRLAISNIQGISGIKDPLNIAILTGFMLCSEINKLRMKADEDHATSEKALDRATALVQHLDRVIERAHLANELPADG